MANKSNRVPVPALFLSCVCLATGGCATVVSKYISSQRSHDFAQVASEQQLLEQGFLKHKFCSKRDGLCMSYLVAQPLGSSQRLSYDVQIDAAGKTDRISLQLDRRSLSGSLHGTVLLLHGFRASKEFMANTALYFRFLGFEVLMPDLLGHGESDGKLSFGIADSEILSELLDGRPERSGPLYVVGNSMGAVAATYLAASRSDIHGLILQAPMTEFDRAAVNYIENYSPLLARCLTEDVIKSGALKALSAAGVTLQQTGIRPLLSSLPMFVLIMASPSDPVSPFDYFSSLESETVAVRKVDDRSHAGMAVIGQIEGDLISRWLLTVSTREK